MHQSIMNRGPGLASLRVTASGQRGFARPRPGRARHSWQSVKVDTDIIGESDQQKLEYLSQKFKLADVDGNGTIDREELRHLLESTEAGNACTLMAHHWLPEEELDRVLAKYDTDGNGAIDFSEFSDLVADGLLLDGKLCEYEAAFRAVDVSGNGSIGATELQGLFKDLGSPQNYDKIVEMFQTYDIDQSGQIEFSEFLLMFRDQLLDLKHIEDYVLSRPPTAEEEATLLQAHSGEIALIMSEAELEEVMERFPDDLVVVFCALTWCRPCRGLERPAAKIAKLYSRARVLKLYGNANVQTKRLFRDRLKVRSTPSFLFFRGGELVATYTGANKEKLEAKVHEMLRPDERPETSVYFNIGSAAATAAAATVAA